IAPFAPSFSFDLSTFAKGFEPLCQTTSSQKKRSRSEKSCRPTMFISLFSKGLGFSANKIIIALHFQFFRSQTEQKRSKAGQRIFAVRVERIHSSTFLAEPIETRLDFGMGARRTRNIIGV